MYDYSCPEGSLVIFTEALTHAGGLWCGDVPQIAIFNAYGPVMAQYHRNDLSREVIEAMPPTHKRQTLFRGVWGHGGEPNTNVSKNDKIRIEKRNCVSKTRKFAFKMRNFAGLLRQRDKLRLVIS